MGRQQSLSRPPCKLLPSGLAFDTLVEPKDILCIELDALDVGFLAAGRALVVGTHKIRKCGQSWIINDVFVNGVLYSSILLEIVLVDNRILFGHLLFIGTRTALAKGLLVSLLDAVEEVVAVLAEF